MAIPKFKRTETKFMGGDCPRHATDLMGRTDYVDECDVDILKCVSVEHDLWRVSAHDSRGDFLAYGDDMHPHPEAHPTNVEAVTHLMEHGSTAFVQAFLMEGAIRYADQVLADEAATREAMKNHFISPDLMINTATEVRDYLNDHLKP